jgi:hypothetical protein
VAGSGILAATLPDAPASLKVGNITVLTPKGNITASEGGIAQLPQNNNGSYAPTITMSAGSEAGGKVTSANDIDLGNSGAIGINVTLKATRDVKGLVIAQHNANITATENVIGTFLAGGNATFSAGQGIIGLAIAGGGINVGSGKFEGVALSQSVSGGGAQSALASTASSAATSQTAAATQANSDKSDTSDALAAANPDDDAKRLVKRPVLAKYVGRVTVLLPPIR